MHLDLRLTASYKTTQIASWTAGEEMNKIINTVKT